VKANRVGGGHWESFRAASRGNPEFLAVGTGC
jgi:hypothetical protein